MSTDEQFELENAALDFAEAFESWKKRPTVAATRRTSWARKALYKMAREFAKTKLDDFYETP